ncbi:FAD-dependent oxidoreductase [Epibacterium sp. SM1969]|uniref:FAD-dependent oxidoreductase n=1 Tax=Tritonibacter aquimaris TaxID=2663379 RepID=A0A844B1N6_9RHOB|nr:FAD-binding oxidoreductase [Tritonibacter aquimaris]MQY44011.1 FAD-dependent oxidoreductase [Tritonibacter aquimaris]
MAPRILPVTTSTEMPKSTTVAIIGGGIVGLSAALTLAERGVPVVVLEKGTLAAEQSSRNLGWVRKTSRAAADIPLALAADEMWAQMPQRVGGDVGYRQNGIMFVAGSDAEMATYEGWHNGVQGLSLDSRMLSQAEIDTLVPGGSGRWKGGVYTPSDGKAEPTMASSMIASAAMAKGAVILENCAVRCLSQSGGRVSGVVTEKGEIACDQVILAGGLWSRRFLGNMGIALPTLPLICYAFRTAPMEGPGEIAVGGPDFSFRRCHTGGYVITHRAALGAPLVLDHALIGMKYLPMLKHTSGMLRYIFGKPFLDDLRLPRRWGAHSRSPFERQRVMDPPENPRINAQALANIAKSWPAFRDLKIEEAWAGTMDITPDSNPVLDRVDSLPGLTLATGMSGHGFGTGPAAGQLAADLATQATPLVDLSPYRLDRF